ncbi:DUF3221 domain-containing protein [Sporosarcina sp. Marseille-Q4063]|uniref:DUF3221 domain-containing protein n=1 Tax=Sporosarcina sp. Marseille-Q4063 TaxID=2810514 RepID=UPI001BAF81A6|nr:DUF3221 domain-containing protein [Sporosarcina sp. Marseille-Q4063]QUW20547.1 DUF3221 domain-containing protein [Sporosarcina sp. Marseille-Q4063]
MKIRKAILLSTVTIILFGCGKTTENMTAEKLIQEASVVLMSENQSLLADATMWKLTDETKIQSHTGTKTTISDLKVGDLISYENEGPIAESYPQQGTLKEITLFNDDQAIKFSSAIASFLENQPHGDLVEFEILSIDGNELSARMKVWDFEIDGHYLAQINLETNEFKITKE